MLLCKQIDYPGIWYTYIVFHQAVRKTQRMRMPKTISIALPQSASLLGQLLALIDRALMASARAAVRNGDPPHFGL